ncbi:hypothetical protein DTL21_09345 [Bremerella cremea]|uniref:Uncharacterized protein n=1 Tax=Blastopirellula marina TaxID=124 RepID=A0A2S8FVC8_9BACT|nr:MULTISPECIES: hypothetical protein [Pirellulaceae]PQO36113.1 hypothetical protein C5Y83_09340 [Blastopirellula marina]RCS48790.1 hypothetical protein DTL21_09345 [Bremerella cremea]
MPGVCATLNRCSDRSRLAKIADAKLAGIVKVFASAEEEAIDSTGLGLTLTDLYFSFRERSGSKREEFRETSICVLVG